MDLRDLYQDIILDHGRHPRNFRVLPGASHFAHGHNPLCGDKVTIFVRLEDGRVADVSFEGKGCAISIASASLMTEIMLDKTMAEAQALFAHFHAQVTGGDETDLSPGLAEEGDRLEPLAGVRSYPARVKCATLAWHTFDAAMAGAAGGSGPLKTE
ncbi:SUF system NifU family Fe-S cluster assembly protein [Nitrospirillum sp. BR 11164]|uniref:Fe-S cluster assembly sulfur transfer protein SufU n=1 Tax=Nitrospirillum sp. BR 11164 TaxID=3104324 RepID=UPI002AFFD6EF|nr:SUF system NifU family Fe-S cluster assembly protein [Nitrospirillum sp. BR 11164]MEA1651193.1 SUF system NifU family Fe-S cluster assembly protein [Nitrospirillum sp. BR 11164]